MTNTTDDKRIATAIYTVNRHAKTAIDNKPLYELKKLALHKMLTENKAKKIGLHFVRNPRFSQQQSSVLIQCADLDLFHVKTIQCLSWQLDLKVYSPRTQIASQLFQPIYPL